MEHWLWIILAALSTLGCTFETTIYSIQWYRQYQRSRPEFLLYITEQGQIQPVRSDFSAHINSKEKRVDLEIKSAAVSDSAVYYCALEPTVTGNTKTLYKNLWSKDNTILHNIHQREPHTVKFKEHHTASIKSTNVRDINQCPSSPINKLLNFRNDFTLLSNLRWRKLDFTTKINQFIKFH
uniref:Ig-like domain-containing protein n=1 Tax=Mastacembelus armatus TaxID=205130 RepID=A0A3Q3MKK0_9TELE